MLQKYSKYFLLFIGLLFASVLTGCTQVKKDNLSLWYNEAPAKQALVSYIKDITNKKSANYIPVENRIAVFDLDGTLILETDPTYFDWALFEHRVLDDKSYKATSEQLEAAKNSREKGLFPTLNANREKMVSEAYKGMTIEEFYTFVSNFMQQDQPGFTNMKRGDIFYKPMVEVVEYLIKNKFRVYICSGSDRLTVRPLVKENLPSVLPSQIIGSDSTIISSNQADKDGLSYTFKAGDKLVLGGKNLVKNLQMNKVSIIAREIGAQPVLAFGNASSDASMINYTINGNKYKALGFMLLCDDLEREYGNLQKAQKMRQDSLKYGWIPVSMRDDWKTIYGPHIQKRNLKK
ncbi:MAG: haloacid dehalogenase-like hydrolase [Elusimicrobiaceae bacterium]|nr:haloacid dehalogenase-like hydrolase [Elusimicrobiaceae bacterium]